MLAAIDLGKRYEFRWIFRHVGFEIHPGECMVVLGPNGSGKSTLLRTLAGLIPASEGKVSLPTGALPLTLGYAALEGALYPDLTCAEHLEFTANLRGCEAKSRLLLEQVGLKGAINKRAKEMSTGMKARLKIAIALQPNPAVLILDEPGAGLDEDGRALVESIIAHQVKTGCVIIATNDPAERRFASREFKLV